MVLRRRKGLSDEAVSRRGSRAGRRGSARRPACRRRRRGSRRVARAPCGHADTGDPAPTSGRPGSMCFSTASARCACPVKSASSRARSLTEPATSPDITGGSALTTGICETPYSRRICTASRIVSPGWVCTRAGMSPDLRVQHVADRRLGVVAEEAVGVHPLVVEDLRHVAATRVGQQHDDDGVLGQVLGGAQGGDDGHAARATDEQALLAGEAAGHLEGVGVADTAMTSSTTDGS